MKKLIFIFLVFAFITPAKLKAEKWIILDSLRSNKDWAEQLYRFLAF